jgi:hypothetical membrane protein
MACHRSGENSPVSRIRTFHDRFPYLGPIVWMSTVEYYAIQVIVAFDWITPYSLLRNPISDLGNTHCGIYAHRQVCSPLHGLMNAAFIVLGVLMIVGAPLIYLEFRERFSATLGFGCMAIAGLGTVLVGLAPENVNITLHKIGASGPFLVGNVGLIILSWALDLPRHMRLYTRVSGIVALVALVLLVLGAYLGLGEGGMERLTAYPQTFWLIIFGTYISRDHYTKRLARSAAAPITHRA